MSERRATRNAASSVAQTVLSALLLFGLYRYLLGAVGADGIGVWSVVLASTGAARVADLGLTGSAVKYVAAYLARGDGATAAEVAETTVVTVAAVIGAMALGAYAAVGALLPLVIPPEGLAAARELLPWACVSFWLVSVAGAAQSGLDGCARYTVRNAILLGAQALYVGLAVGLVGPYGLVGLAWAQIAQGAAWSVALWAALRRALPEASPVPFRWRGALVREMLGYGAGFQALGVLRMLYEPTTKALMSRYGGLDAAGLYEMATLAVTKLRALLVAAQQVLTPEVAALQERAPERVAAVYREADRLNWALTLPLFAGVAAGAPLLSHVWLGGFDARFVLFSGVLAAGWFANTLSGPAFFLLLGTGEMRPVVWSHVTIGAANAAAGLALGEALGAGGVAAGWALALGAGAAHLLGWLWRERRLGLSAGVGAYSAVVLGAAAAALALALRWPQSPAVAAAAAAAFGLVGAVALWRTPARARIAAVLGSAFG